MALFAVRPARAHSRTSNRRSTASSRRLTLQSKGHKLGAEQLKLVSNMNWQNPAGRLVIASVVVGLAMFGLFQAGIIFQSSQTKVTSTDGPTLTIAAADVTPETPNPTGLTVGLKAGNLAPNFEFSAFDGRRLSLSDFRGQPVFLNFWASWCGPCRAEMPNMQTMLDLYGKDGLAIIGVNAGEALTPAQRFIDGLEVDFTAFAYDPTQEIIRLFAVQGLPVSYFIDADGVITRVIAGQLSYEVMNGSVLEILGGPEAISN